MDTKVQVLALTLAFIVILLPAADQAEARAAKDCNIADLLSCMPCIRNTKPDPEPSDECCKALKKADLPCLCSSYKNSPNLNKYVNPKLAMELPAKCKLSVPNECH
ncbi:putative lipid-transfer protein DIR1 [Carex rostrata]